MAINLLPWRQNLRKQQQYHYLIIIICNISISVLALTTGYLYLTHQITRQQTINYSLTQKIKGLTNTNEH